VDPVIAWLPALIGLAAGAAAGWGIRLLLARLRHGVLVRPGLLEASAALITAVGVGLTWPGALVALVVWAGLLGVALGAVDLVHHRLPDALTLPAIPITVVLIGSTELTAPATGSVITALIVAVVLGGAFWALSALAPRAMGLGDVKLVPSLALMTGYVSVAAGVLAVVIAFVLGAVVALLGMLTRRLGLGSAIPFGPFLLAGCWLVLALPGLVGFVVG
jgi:leader peptidase (prepilin peptidase)/N-methyltransferase